MSLPSDIFDVRKSPKKRAESEISGPSTKSITAEPVRRSPRKKAARMNYAEDTQDDEIIAVETVRGKDKAGVSPTKAVVRKRRSLKPVEGGLALRLETAAEVAESVIEAETKISLDEGDEPKTRATREGEPIRRFFTTIKINADRFVLSDPSHTSRGCSRADPHANGQGGDWPTCGAYRGGDDVSTVRARNPGGRGNWWQAKASEEERELQRAKPALVSRAASGVLDQS